MSAAPRGRSMARVAKGGAFVLAFAGLLACGPSAQLKQPPGFARYLDADNFKVISADGFRMEVRRVANDPAASVELWTEGVRQNLENEGYRIVEVAPVSAKEGAAGRRILALYRQQERDYAYLVALFVRGEHVFLVEAAGTYDLYQKRAADIAASISSFQVK